MVSLALSVALLSSSGGLLAGRLPAGVRLLDAPTTAFGVVLGASGEKQLNLEAMTRGELEMERVRLLDRQPSMVPGVIVGGVGLASLVVGVVIKAVAERTLGTATGWLFIAGGAGALVTGVVLIIVAAINGPPLASALRRVDQRINTLLQQQGQPGEGEAPPPPPPPPPPPGAWRDLPQPPRVLVATF